MSAIAEFLNVLSGANVEIEKLKKENEAWKKRDAWCQDRIEKLEARVDRLRRQRVSLLSEKSDLMRTVGNLKDINEELVRRLAVLGLETVNDAEESKSEEKGGLEKLLDSPLEEVLFLEAKTYNNLLRANYRTVRDVCQSRASELLEVRNFGKHCLNDLNYGILMASLALMPEETEKEQRKIDKILMPSRARATKLESLGLSVRTYSELRTEGCKTVADIILDRSWKPYSKSEILERFGSSTGVNEFLTRIGELGFMA